LKNIFLIILFQVILLFACCSSEDKSYSFQTLEFLKDSTLILAKEYLKEAPKTVTSDTCSRSQGGIHDYYSEGDYWWPDETNPGGPYIQRDGMSNPDNFTAHRESLIRLSEIVGNLTSAFIITKDSVYADAAIAHCKAWFIDDSTKMNPNLLYAQAIQGRHSGRGIGIIDAIHFMEVVQSLIVLERHSMTVKTEMNAFRAWFAAFLTWLTTHQYGHDEMVHPNNHGTCWNMQAGLYAVFTNNDSVLSFCRDNYKNAILPNQMAEDGSFPLELARTKPYGYSLFNLDAMAMNCLILSDKSNNLWEYTAGTNKTILRGLDFMEPFVEDKSNWTLKPDVMYWDELPLAQPAYLFGAVIFDRRDFFELWKNKQHFPDIYEIRRNLPIRNPLIWMSCLNLD
jgi:hypothetical protein